MLNLFKEISISLAFMHPFYLNLVIIWKYLVVSSIPIDLEQNLPNYKGILPTEHPTVNTLVSATLLPILALIISANYTTYEFGSR